MPELNYSGAVNAAERADLLSAASSLVPLLRGNAERADRDRRLTDVGIAGLREAGFFRLSTPRANGGRAVDLRTFLALSAELGRGCSASAWVASIFYGGGLMVGLFGDRVRDEVWGSGPDTTVCGSIGGRGGSARKVDGGWVVSGRWGWSSGVRHAQWTVLGVAGEPEKALPYRGLALVPVAELSIEDTWRMVGMRGTGSDTVVAENVFVPDDHVLSLETVRCGMPRGRGADGCLTRVPFPVTLMLALTGPLLGMARAAHDHTVQRLKQGRPLVSAVTLHSRAADSAAVQANIAESAMLIDSAWMHAERAAADVDQATYECVDLDSARTVRLRMDMCYAARHAQKSVDLVLDVGGAGAFAESSPTQRIWRDLGTASRHPAFDLEVTRELYGRYLLDAEVPPVLVL